MDLKRHLLGREDFSKFLDRWIKQSTLSSAAFCRIANQLLGSNRLHPTQLSGLRNGLCKQISVYTFDALGALSAAVYAYHRQGKTFANVNTDELQLLPPFGDEEGAYGAAEIVELYLGLRPCPELPENWLGADFKDAIGQDELLADSNVGRVLRAALSQMEGDLLDNLDDLMVHYPSKDADRIQRLKAVALGLEGLDGREGETEMLAICVALTGMTGEKWDLRRLTRNEASNSQSSTRDR